MHRLDIKTRCQAHVSYSYKQQCSLHVSVNSATSAVTDFPHRFRLHREVEFFALQYPVSRTLAFQSTKLKSSSPLGVFLTSTWGKDMGQPTLYNKSRKSPNTAPSESAPRSRESDPHTPRRNTDTTNLVCTALDTAPRRRGSVW